MPTSGDTTLQTLPQPPISSASFQNVPNKNEEESINNAECSKNVDPECKESQYESSQNETQRERNKNNGQENAGTEEETKEDSSEEGRDIKQLTKVSFVLI